MYKYTCVYIIYTYMNEYIYIHMSYDYIYMYWTLTLHYHWNMPLTYARRALLYHMSRPFKHKTHLAYWELYAPKNKKNMLVHPDSATAQLAIMSWVSWKLDLNISNGSPRLSQWQLYLPLHEVPQQFLCPTSNFAMFGCPCAMYINIITHTHIYIYLNVYVNIYIYMYLLYIRMIMYVPLHIHTHTYNI